MSKRIQVVVDEEEREVFRRRAAADGVSLSTWLREAGRRRVELEGGRVARTGEDVRRFFAALADGSGREPDWQEHRSVIDASRREGISPT